jgi:hypothetical protein
MSKLLSLFTCVWFAGVASQGLAQDPGWQHSGSFFILTTPEGANLPATASEEGFPLLVRLNKGDFDFSQAKPDGSDIRFSAGGQPLAYEIDEWDAEKGVACIWVQVPVIKGNARQEIKLHWGKADAAGESSGSAVFNESNGYLSVWHMNDPVKDEVGTVVSKDTGTTASAGLIGNSRHFDLGKGISCGENITTYPTGSSPHSSEVWFKAQQANASILGWGNDHPQGKVIMQLFSPPHIKIECWFSGADVRARAFFHCPNGSTRSTPSRTGIRGSTSTGSWMAFQHPPAPRWRSRVLGGCISAGGTITSDSLATSTRCVFPG